MNQKLTAFIFFLFSVCFSANAQRPFITVWQTPNTVIRIDAIGEFTYTWKDINNALHTGSGAGGTTSAGVSSTNISFGTAGRYQLEITPAAGGRPFSHLEMNYGYPDANYLREVIQWGDVAWSSMAFTFMGAQNLSAVPSDVPDLSEVTDMSNMFLDCFVLTTIPHIDQWDVSHVTDMNRLFGFCMVLTNIPGISEWDVSKVKDMSGMFAAAHLFNENISGWNVGQVENMENMFADAPKFNIDISGWDVSNVTDMNNMFYVATAFNQPIGQWKEKTGKVQNTMAMFASATAFNQDLNEWDMSQVTDMQQMFLGATAFNGDISDWDVSKVAYMSGMFGQATSFNRDISRWDVRNVVNMSDMFSGATTFNANVGGWDVRKVTNTSYMFYRAAAFNQNIGAWKLNALTTSMFSSSAEGMLSNSGMDCINYSKTLIGWAGNIDHIQGGLKLGADGLKYGLGDPYDARQTLRSKFTITGDVTGDCVVSLPVHFGDITALFKGNNLYVNWTTLSEAGNSYFDIEASADGKNFIKMGEVKSLAVDGNTSAALKYSFSKDAAAGSGLLGISVLALALGLSITGRGRKKVCQMLAITGMVMISLAACSKNDAPADFSNNGKLFIRIKQVDKDGHFEYSKTVKVIME